MTEPDTYPTLTGLGADRLLAGGWRVAVVGAGGWIGLAALEQLHQLLGVKAFRKRVIAYGSKGRRLSLRGALTVDQLPLAEFRFLPRASTLVLHLAFLTQEKAGTMSADEYVARNNLISRQVLEALDPIGAEGVYVASSGAVELAHLPDVHANKALYGRLKLEDEARFSSWAEERGKRAVLSRIYGLSGPYINKLDSYALACFITDVLAERPIAVSAARPVFRSYVAVDELISVVFGLLTDGSVGSTLFDTGTIRGYEMGEIAESVARALDHPLPSTRHHMTEPGEDRYVGDGRIYESLRDRLHVRHVNFREQVRQTARFMAEARARLEFATPKTTDKNWTLTS